MRNKQDISVTACYYMHGWFALMAVYMNDVTAPRAWSHAIMAAALLRISIAISMLKTTQIEQLENAYILFYFHGISYIIISHMCRHQYVEIMLLVVCVFNKQDI